MGDAGERSYLGKAGFDYYPFGGYVSVCLDLGHPDWYLLSDPPVLLSRLSFHFLWFSRPGGSQLHASPGLDVGWLCLLRPGCGGPLLARVQERPLELGQGVGYDQASLDTN